jgi:hypothetical protein
MILVFGHAVGMPILVATDYASSNSPRLFFLGSSLYTAIFIPHSPRYSQKAVQSGFQEWVILQCND